MGKVVKIGHQLHNTSSEAADTNKNIIPSSVKELGIFMQQFKKICTIKKNVLCSAKSFKTIF